MSMGPKQGRKSNAKLSRERQNRRDSMRYLYRRKIRTTGKLPEELGLPEWLYDKFDRLEHQQKNND